MPFCLVRCLKLKRLKCRNLKNVADADYLSGRPLPTAPDGRYEGELTATTDASNDNYHSKLYKLIQDVQTASKQGAPIQDPVGFAVSVS